MLGEAEVHTIVSRKLRVQPTKQFSSLVCFVNRKMIYFEKRVSTSRMNAEVELISISY